MARHVDGDLKSAPDKTKHSRTRRAPWRILADVLWYDACFSAGGLAPVLWACGTLDPITYYAESFY
jgi:hypothetical protein